MRIASFNIKHKIFRNNKIISKNVLKIIEDNGIDILCTQEIPRTLARSFDKYMSGYTVNGDSRYHNYLKNLPYNEKNPIITKNKIIETRTIRYKNKFKNIKEFFKYLRHIPIFPRIATIVTINIEKDLNLCVINTHLDYKLSIIQEKQLNHLLEIIKEYMKKGNIILTGDFNMDLDDKHFVSFISILKSCGIDMINIGKTTWKSKRGDEKTLDYMFVSNKLTLSSFGVIKSGDLSDHEIIYADIKI